jgi:Mg2+ and Co2+ transporter CorA
MAVYGPRGPGYAHKEYKPYHIQDLQYWSDKIKEAILILKANLEVVSALRKFYLNLQEQRDFPQQLATSCTEEVAEFRVHLDEIMAEFKMHTPHAQLLESIISGRKELVLQHLQGQATERTERLNVNLEKEAIVMRIITLVTLFYLPATFVSVSLSFFVRRLPAEP